MSLEKPRPRPRRSGIESEEERAWVGFYKRVGRDPAIADRSHGPARVRSRNEAYPSGAVPVLQGILRRHKARQARNKRIGQFVRWSPVDLPWAWRHPFQKEFIHDIHC
jgi:hypothetical protein